MNILVTGGAGFIGSHLVDALIRQDHDVILVDNLHTGRQANVNDRALFYHMDLTDHEGLAQIFERNQIEVVFHLAALCNVRESMMHPAAYADVNVTATLALMELARLGDVEQFVFASSGGAVYGEGLRQDGSHEPFREQDAVCPLDNYAANKLAIEYHLQLYRAAYDFPCVTLRLANVYGPRQHPLGDAGVAALFSHAMLHNREVRIHGEGTQARDFCYVSDVVDAFLAALKYRSLGVYNVGSGQPTTVLQIFRQLAAIIGYPLAPVHTERPVGEVTMNYLDTAKALKDWGWSARVELGQGLVQTVTAMRREP